MGHNPGDGSSKHLRREAESRVTRTRDEPASSAAAPEDDRLLHELRVHQIELEMQNDELRRTQQELEESRDRYWALYDYAPVGYLTLDRAGRILEANLTAAQLLGIEAGVLPGMALTGFMSRGDADAFHLHQKAVFSAETKQGWDCWLRRPDGATLPVHVDSIAELESKDPTGRPTRCRTVLVDVTDLRRAQDDARTHESRTRTLLDTAADAIVSTDAAGNIESMNAAAERLFGYKEGEIRGGHVRVLMPAPSGDDPGGLIGPSSREALGVKKDGTICPIEVSVGEWWDHGARKLTAIIRDISARKQAERQLQESEARFRQIAEHIDDLFYVREPSGVASYVSPAFERIWGRPAAELAGNPSAWLDTIHPDDRERVAEAWERMRTGSAISEAYRICRPDGTIRWVSSRGFPVEGLNGKVLRNVGVVRDITNERKLEEDLRQSQKMEAVGTLASGVAHNLRNVLQAVLAFIHIARRKGVGTERAGDALERAVATAKRGATLTDQLLAFSRKWDVNVKPVRVDGAVHDAGQLIKPLIGEQVVLEIVPGAPDAVIMADPVQLEHILLNLAANARDAMPNGGTLTIATEAIVLDEQAARTHAVATGPHVTIVVRDTGSGMDPATMARIFEPFFTTKDVGKGTGLGLATVFALTRQMGGCIEVDSALGQGSSFTLCFPSVHASLTPDPPPAGGSG